MNYKQAIPLLVLLALSQLQVGCLYTARQVEEIKGKVRQMGFAEGRANEIRHSEHQRQQDLARKQIKERYYKVLVPEHTNEAGIKIEEHYVPIRVITE